ncbi:MAG: T9SS type A sorting domain-containing protein [Flavobacteriaceae bacterium]
MKKLYSIICFVFFFSNAATQPSELFEHTWYLHYVEFDLGGGYSISSIQPAIAPFLIINEDLSFEGFGACNEFSGFFQYETSSGTELLYPFDFERTYEECINQDHITFESEYFSWFDHDDELRFEVFCNSNNDCDFIIEYFAGFFYVFSNSPLLSNTEIELISFKLYPNPVDEVLTIVSLNQKIEEINIYSIAGAQLFQTGYQQQIDVSHLTSGIYFIEITSTQGKSVQKFVKH